MLDDGEARPSDLRHFIAAWPYLNDGALEPAAKATAAKTVAKAEPKPAAAKKPVAKKTAGAAK